MTVKSDCTRAWNNACALAGAKLRAAGEIVPAGANLAVLVPIIAKRCGLAEPSHRARSEFVAAYLTGKIGREVVPAREADAMRRPQFRPGAALRAAYARAAADQPRLVHACSNVMNWDSDREAR